MDSTNSHRRWPAEWERQQATWIAWPHNLETWPGRFEPIPNVFARLVAVLAEVQDVHIVGDATVLQHAAKTVGHCERVTLHEIPTNDSWIRDYGPTFVQDAGANDLVGVDWRYNAWGGKYPPYDRDAAAASLVCQAISCAVESSQLCCEGGAIEGNGRGTLLTTESCLLSPARNADWTRDTIEAEFQRRLGVRKIVWIADGGLAGDDTDGHIDQQARFVQENVLVVAASENADDPNCAGLEAMYASLQRQTTADGKRLEVHRLFTPPPRYVDGTRVPESYCNFVFANGVVIVPTFRNPRSDEAAIELLQSFFPDRQVIALDAYDLVWGLGAFHCTTQQQPRPGC